MDISLLKLASQRGKKVSVRAVVFTDVLWLIFKDAIIVNEKV